MNFKFGMQNYKGLTGSRKVFIFMDERQSKLGKQHRQLQGFTSVH